MDPPPSSDALEGGEGWIFNQYRKMGLVWLYSKKIVNLAVIVSVLWNIIFIGGPPPSDMSEGGGDYFIDLGRGAWYDYLQKNPK